MHRRRQAALVFGALAVVCPCVFALNPSLEVSQYGHAAWTVRDGFFNGGINAISQDRQGYLLLASEHGLLRFDGVGPTPWPPGEKIARGDIRTVLAASDGRLWAGMESGLASWKNGHRTDYPELAGQRVLSILEDTHGTVWVSGYELPTGRLCAFRDGTADCAGMSGEFARGVTSLYGSPGGELWASAPNGLWRWRPSPSKNYSKPGPSLNIRALAKGGGSFLIATQHGIYQLLGEELRPYPPLAAYDFLALALLENREGGLWIGTDGHGLLHLHESRVDRFTSVDGLSGNTVNSIFEDREGNIWVGTDGGLDRFRDLAAASISAKQGLSSAAVNSVMAARDGSIWIGTRNGLDRWKDGEMTVFKRPGRSPVEGEGLAHVVVDKNLPDDNAQATFEDSQGRIWVCSPHGVAYFDSGRLTRVSTEPEGMVSTIAGDRSGNLWISDEYKGLIHYSGARKVEQAQWAKLGRPDFASGIATVPSENGVWLGFRNGGVGYYENGRMLQSYSAKDGIGQGTVNGLTLDADGALWVYTEGGLSRIQAGTISTLTTRNGLPCNSVYWMAKGQDSSIWMYMGCGLARIDRSELMAWLANPAHVMKLMTFDGSDGVISHSLTTASSAVGHIPGPSLAPDGRLWFAPVSAASYIDPSRLPFNKLPPPLHIEQIVADGTTYQIGSGLHLPPLVRNLSVDFVALSLVAPAKNQYRFKLEGWDRDWRAAVKELRVEYSNLPPRKYRFHVIASNNSGVWNETGDTLEFFIDPAYYQTNWFRALMAGVVLTMLWGLYRLRLYQIAREFNAQLDGRVEERLRVARELHDTLLQSFHSLLPRFQAVYNLLPGRSADAKQVLEKALDDAGNAITEARDAVQGMRSSAVVTNDLAKGVETFGEELAAHQASTNGNAAGFAVEVQGAPQDLHPILRDEIYRIAAEALRNAFHHAHARRIEVEIRYGPRDFRVRVRDDGAGIDPSILGREGRAGHFGLRGMRERAGQIGGKLEVWSEHGAGTEIELTLPASVAYGRRDGWRSRFFRLAEKR